MKNSYIICISFIIFIFFSSCYVSGEYYSGSDYQYTKLYLKKDNTFTYELFFDVGGVLPSITGSWIYKGDKLILNTFDTPKFIPNSIFDTIIPGIDNKFILIQNMDVSAESTIISINNGEKIDTTFYLYDLIKSTNKIYEYYKKENYIYGTGIVTDIDSIKSIQILDSEYWSDLVLDKDIFYPLNPQSNLIVIITKPYNFYYEMKYFVNTEWKIKNRKIYYWKTLENEFNENIYLKKVKNK